MGAKQSGAGAMKFAYFEEFDQLFTDTYGFMYFSNS